MENSEQQNQSSGGGHFNPEDRKQGAIIYFLGIIVVSVIAVGFLIFRSIGLI